MQCFSRLSLLVGALMLIGSGCGDSSTGGGGGTPTVPDGSDGVSFSDTKPADDTPQVAEDAPLPPPGGEKLDFGLQQGDDGKPCSGTNRCAIFMSFNSQRNLDVVATRNGAPAGELQIVWKITKNKNNSLQLGSKTTYTAQDGKSTNTVKQVAQQEAQYEVEVTIHGSEAPPLYFDVVVTPKGQVPLIVSYTYKGTRNFQAITTYLFKHESPQTALKCDGLDPAKLPTADLSSPPKGLTQSAAFPSLPDLDKDGTQTYTIVGIGADQNGPPLVFGCDDTKGVVTYVGSTNVVIDLVDLPPLWKGSYDVTTKFDLVSALPDNVESVVNTILGFFTDPSGQLLVLVCQFGGDVGVIGDLCGFIFNDPANPCLEDNCFDSIGLAAKNLIDNLLVSLLEDNIGGDILFTGADIAKILKELELTATFEFKNEPKEDGTYTTADTFEEWHSVTYRWTLGTNCPPADKNCGKHTFSVNAFQGNTIVGEFAGHVEYPEGANHLHIDTHPLDINYGALLLYIIEKEILPRIAGDGSDGVKIDTIGKFVKSLMGGSECLKWEIDPSIDQTCCGQFAESISGSSTGGLTSDIAKAACVAGVPLLEGALKDLLLDLDVGTGDSFTLATKAACSCFDHDANMSIDAWGSLDKPCIWDTTIKFGDTEVKVDNTFQGIEQQ